MTEKLNYFLTLDIMQLEYVMFFPNPSDTLWGPSDNVYLMDIDSWRI